MSARLRKIHRYVGLALLALWLVQAATGVLMVFHWEIEDALVAGSAAPLYPKALDARLAALTSEEHGRRVTSVYPTGGTSGRFDVFLETERGETGVVRIDGVGTVLARWTSTGDPGLGGLIRAATVLHQSLFAGDGGRLLLGVSGIILLSNIIIGVRLAWPRGRQWAHAMWPVGKANGAARWYAWHRAAGLWLCMPVFLMVGAGILLALDDPLENWLHTAFVPPTVAAPDPASMATISAGQAIEVALARFPGAEFSGLRMPQMQQPWYRVRVRQTAEPRRIFGTTAVYVSAADGRMLAVEDALAAPFARSALDWAYPIHTGEFAGLAGRLLVFTAGVLLIISIGCGSALWWSRRRPARFRA
jgi:uncharacterized iron-regulated membrane protein